MNVYTLAAEFSQRLRECLTPEQMAEVNARNQADEFCHSHDFVDANVVMLEAWHALDPGRDLREITHQPKNASRWANAWEIAKVNDFDPEQIREQQREDGIYLERMQGE